MRDELDPILNKQSERSLNQSAHDDRTDERAHAVSAGDADGERKERKRDAHHDRQARTHTPHGEELHQGSYTGDDHTVLDKCGANGAIEPHGRRQDHDGGDVADKHGQHMLQAEGKSLAQRHSTVEPIEVLC